MKRATTKEVRTWLLWIMSRLPTTESETECEAKVQMMAPSLSQSYPMEAFSQDSGNYVLIDLQWFREADIRLRLNKWKQINLPDVSSLPDEAAKAPVDEGGRNWIARYLRAKSDAEAKTTLALIRSYHRPAYGHLLTTDVRAANIAVRHAWPDPNQDHTLEWADPATVTRAIQSCFGSYGDGTHDDPTPKQISDALQTLRALVSRYAPQNLHLIPGEEDDGPERGRFGEVAGDLGGQARLHG